VFSSFYAQPY